jgi:F-type H+-transporting ATPase subunit b
MRRLVTIGLALAAASPAQAATPEGDVFAKLIYPAINLALLLGVLIYFSRKPIQAFFRDRRAQIRSDLETAAQLRTEAEERCAELQRRLVNLDSEIESIRQLARERAESERTRILTDAEATAERIRADAQAAIEQELRRAREQLREDASDLAIELAGERVRDQITDSDRSRLLDEFIDRIESGAAAEKKN